MRIVAGSLRGKVIDAPDGTDTRPTTDRVREALFSSLYSLRGGFDEAVVLDAFAGSGALGLEAISRGAQSCMFYERDARAAKVLRRNVERCGLSRARAEVRQRDVVQAPPAPTASPFDLVFLDPPYAFDAHDVLRLASGLVESGCIAPGAIVAYEHGLAARQAVADAAEQAGFGVHAQKKYGKTAITLLLAQNVEIGSDPFFTFSSKM